MNESNQALGEIIDSTRQDAQARQRQADALAGQPARQPRGKQIFTALLGIALAMVLFYQVPRFTEPYAWPDPATTPAAAEGSLLEVVTLIEAHRMAKGKLPDVLSQVPMPDGIAALMAESLLVYRPTDTTYTLDWTLPHWRASFDSQTEKVSVAPVGRP